MTKIEKTIKWNESIDFLVWDSVVFDSEHEILFQEFHCLLSKI